MIDPMFEELALLLTLSTPFIILVLCYVCYLRTTPVRARYLNSSIWGYIYSDRQWLAQLRLNILHNDEGKCIRICRLLHPDEFYYLDDWVYNRLYTLSSVEGRNLFSKLLNITDLTEVEFLDVEEIEMREVSHHDNFKEYLK